MRCPSCASIDDKVVDSRLADDGAAIRRRRECLGCGRRFTTYERIERVDELIVLKRSGHREPFDRSKVVAGVRAAAKNRPVSPEQMEAVAADVEERMRLGPSGPTGQRAENQVAVVTTQEIGLAVLDRLRVIDDVTYLRFASVYKGFTGAGDFEREVGLLTKSTEPKPHP